MTERRRASRERGLGGLDPALGPRELGIAPSLISLGGALDTQTPQTSQTKSGAPREVDSQSLRGLSRGLGTGTNSSRVSTKRRGDKWNLKGHEGCAFWQSVAFSVASPLHVSAFIQSTEIVKVGPGQLECRPQDGWIVSLHKPMHKQCIDEFSSPEHGGRRQPINPPFQCRQTLFPFLALMVPASAGLRVVILNV